MGLAWDAPTTNSDGTQLTDLSHYRVYVGTSSSSCPGPTFKQVPSPVPSPAVGDVVTTQVTGLTTGTTYVTQVTAVDTGGNESVCSNQATGQAKADPLDTTAPSGTITINSNATYTNWTAATLGLAATDGVGVTAYYVSTGSTRPSATATGWVAVTPTTSYSNNNVPYTLSSGNGTKTVYAWYKDAAGNVSPTASDSIILDQTLPTNGTLSATPGNAQVSLSWSGFSDGGSGLAASNRYKLVFSTSGSPNASCINGTQILLGNATGFTHTGRTNGTTYYYRVCAFDNAGNISTGAAASATLQATVPLTLTSLTADKSSPQPVGTPITFTATAVGGTAPYQYRWWLWNGTSWTMVRDWGANTFTWTPLTANPNYQVTVWARSNGTTGDPPEAWRAVSFPITAP